MPDLDDVGVRLRVDDDASMPLIRVRDNAFAATQSLRDIATADPALLGTSMLLDKLARSAIFANLSLEELSLRADTALMKTAGATDHLANSTGNLDRQLDKASSTAMNFFGGVTKYGLAAFAGLTAAVGFFGIQASASFQQTQAALGSLIGSASGGKQLFNELQQFNLKTPFDLPQLTGSAQTLLQYGLPEPQMMGALKTLSNVASVSLNPNEDLLRQSLAFGQISSAHQLRGQDLNQLTQSGFPAIRLLSSVTGLTPAQVQQQIQGGGLSPDNADKFIAAIVSGNNPVLSPYAGAAAAQNNTLRGQFSNLKSNLRTDLNDAASPLNAQLMQTMPVLTDGLHKLLVEAGPPVFAMLGDLVKGLTGLIPVLEPVLGGLAAGLHELMTATGPGMKDLVPVGQELGAAFHELFTDMAGHGDELSQLMVNLVELLPAMVRILDDLLPLVDLFASGLGALLGLGPARDMVAGLLIGLLAYKSLSGVIGIVDSMSHSLRGLAASETAAATAGGPGALGGVGKLGRFAGAAGGGLGVGLMSYDAYKHGAGVGDLLGGAASGAAGGALIGSIVPGPGTAVGALVGGIVGFGATGISGLAGGGGDGGVPKSQIWDPTKAGYGGSVDNSIHIGEVHASADVDVVAALEAAREEQRRRGGNP